MSVGPTRGPVQRPGDDRDFSEIFQRVEDIERVRVGGLQFNEGTYGPLNVGDWLYIETTGFGGPDSAGVAFVVSADFRISLDGSEFNLNTGGGPVLVTSPDVEFTLDGGTFQALDVTPFLVKLASGSSVVRVQNSSGAAIFEIRNDGTFHILTGATWVADL